MTNKKNSSKQKASNVNTIGDFLSEELKNKSTMPLKRKTPLKKITKKQSAINRELKKFITK